VVALAALGAAAAVCVLDGMSQLVAAALVLAVLGLGWGSLRMDALRTSVLVRQLGETGVAELVHRRAREIIPVVDPGHRDDA
jgi:hypothetical protein